MPLTEKQKRALKKTAHHLKPVVMVGQHGISENLIAEVDGALTYHELIKVKVSAGDRDLRDQMIHEISAGTAAQLVQRVGNVAVFYRHNPKKKNPIVLPKD